MRIVSCLALAALVAGAGPAVAGNHANTPGAGKGGGMSASAGSKGAEMSAGKRSTNADLKAVNSLNRSLNGLMNSKDAKMDGFRAFVIDSAEYEEAKAEADAARDTYEPLGLAYFDLIAELGYEELPNTTGAWDALKEALDLIEIDPVPTEADFTEEVEGAPVFDEDAYLAALEDWTEEFGAAQAALDDYQATRDAWYDYALASAEADALEDGASEETMVEAIVAALNATGAGPVEAGDITPEMTEWVAARLGAGDDLDGLIDAYMASLAN